jgi:hypothetical protein
VNRFERTSDGEEVLSESGITEIRSAMTKILRYPPNSPLMVEGFADDADLAEPYLLARRRAALVHDYIVETFHRRRDYTGFIALERDRVEEVEDDGDRLPAAGGIVLSLYYDDDFESPLRPPGIR